jgi:hypothetical protein
MMAFACHATNPLPAGHVMRRRKSLACRTNNGHHQAGPVRPFRADFVEKLLVEAARYH